MFGSAALWCRVCLSPAELCLLFLLPVITQWSMGLAPRDKPESVSFWLHYWGSTHIKSNQGYVCPSASPNTPWGGEFWSLMISTHRSHIISPSLVSTETDILISTCELSLSNFEEGCKRGIKKFYYWLHRCSTAKKK